MSHPYVALSPTLYPLSSRPALPAGECWLILSSAAATNIQPLASHSFTPPHPPRTPSHVSLGLPQEGTRKSPIVLPDDDDKPPPPKRRLSPGHGAPDNDKPKKQHRVMQLQPFHALVVFQPPEPRGGPGSGNAVLCCALCLPMAAREMVNSFHDGGRCVVSSEVSHATLSARWYWWPHTQTSSHCPSASGTAICHHIICARSGTRCHHMVVHRSTGCLGKLRWTWCEWWPCVHRSS